MKLKLLMPFLGLGLLIYIIYSVGVEKIISSLSALKLIYIPLIILIGIFSFILVTYKWKIILGHQKINLKFLNLLKINLISHFYGVITPLRAGYFVKIKLLKDKLKSSYGEALPSVFLDRFLDFLVLFILFLFSTLYIINTKVGFIPKNYLYLEIILLVLFIFSVWFFLSKNKSKFILKLVYKFLIPNKFKDFAKNNYNLFYSSLPRKRKLFYPFLICAFSYLIYFTQIYLIVLALGINFDYITFLAVYPIIMSFSLLPVTLGGLGTRDIATIALFNLFGIGAGQAVALSLLIFVFNDFLFGLTGFILSLKKNDSINNNTV